MHTEAYCTPALHTPYRRNETSENCVQGRTKAFSFLQRLIYLKKFTLDTVNCLRGILSTDDTVETAASPRHVDRRCRQ
jgi:hypothetical protein